MKVITFFRVNLLKTIRQYRVVLSVDVDYLEMLVEGQIQPICQFHFVFILVHFNLLYRLRWVILLQIVSDGLRNQLGWHFSLLAVNLCEISFFIKFQLGSALQNHIIALVDNSRLNGSKYHLLIVEMVAE